MLDRIANILQQECNLLTSDLLVVGVSGGPDSLCLLHLLNSLGYQLVAAHMNHKLRLEADSEAMFVERFTGELGIRFIGTEQNVQSYATEHSFSIEEAARWVRYQFLFEQAEKEGAAAVLVAHNADDQVETILMHLLRGSGLAGLAGMAYQTLPNAWSDSIPLLRPLLSMRRNEIMQYLSANNIVPAFDPSNLDVTYFRNRLRHELLPVLESYNPQIRQNLLRQSHILRDDYSALQALVDEAWRSSLISQETGYLAFHRAGFVGLPVAIQRFFLRRAVGCLLPGLIDVGFDCIERGRQFLHEDRSSGRVNLYSGLWLVCEREVVWLTFSPADLPISNFPALTPGEIITLGIPSLVELNDGWILMVEIPADAGIAINQSAVNIDPYQAWLDVTALPEPLLLRSRKPGDRLQPMGMNGHSIKLSDLMINLKLPPRARKTWPLVCSGDQVLWVPGYRQSGTAAVTPGSKSLVHLTLFRDFPA
jgi:tRNA(Ile)-lysidine synthase